MALLLVEVEPRPCCHACGDVQLFRGVVGTRPRAVPISGLGMSAR